MVELTQRAREALTASQAAAVRFDPDVRLRLRVVGTGEIRSELVTGPTEGDEVLVAGELELFVEPGLRGTIDAGDHNQLQLLIP